MIFWEIIFWCSVILLIHSYIIYPLLLEIFSFRKKQNKVVFSDGEEWPFISILLAVYNEEKVIGEKIKSTLATTYPVDKIEWLIGSDRSDDATDEIIEGYATEFPQVQLTRFEQRTGKVEIINQLASRATGEVLVLTDANVFFTEDTLKELVKHYRNPSISLVAGNILSHTVKESGISRQESGYLFMENRIKYKEGLLRGAMMGAFGGCYSLRKSFFLPTPSNFIVDDFFITMSVLERGGKAICEPNALSYEDVSSRSAEEFRRKTRIATGNFQNLKRFAHLLLPSRGSIAFAFWSHKVLRWMGPFLILMAYLCSFALSFDSIFYKACFWVQTMLLAAPLFDALMQKLKINFPGLRYVSHFYVMNLAMLNGFYKFLKGVKNNVWTPTERNQS